MEKKTEKLRTYRVLKRNLEFEDYLNANDSRGRRAMTTIRGGTSVLRIETGRHRFTNRHKALEVEERVCLICGNGEVEDEDLRKKMREEVGEMSGGEEEIFRKLLGDGVNFPARVRVHAATRIFLRDALQRRKRVTKLLDQWT